MNEGVDSTNAALPSGVLRIRGLSKSFPNVHALQGISLDVHPGEILALMGENGAGKSTLLKILNGDFPSDSGTVSLDDEMLMFSAPSDARRHGIRVIHQEPEIIPGVDVAENIYAGELPTIGPIVDRRKLNELVGADLRRRGFDKVLPADALGDELSSAQRQLVEIMRALKSNVRVLALDEPTSSLTDEEVDRLFDLVRRLRSDGVAIVYVSHRIKEILRLADRVAVLRDGRLVTVRPSNELAEADIVRLMVGRKLHDVFARHKSSSDSTVLLVENIRSQWHRGVDFEIGSGEVVGLAGLIGSGRTELAKVIFGALPRDSGRTFVEGVEVHIRQPSDAIRAGLGFAPEDRKREGIVPMMSVLGNASLAILGELSRFLIVNRRLERRTVTAFIRRLRIQTPSLEQHADKLSGGNQQKVVLSRWMAARPKVLILDEPTRGIDIGAKAEIYRLIDELASDGLGIMLISSELPELLGMADRIYVMQSGRITGELPGAGTSEEEVLRLAMAEHLTTPHAVGPPILQQGNPR